MIRALLFLMTFLSIAATAAVITENLAVPDADWRYNDGREFPGAKGELNFDAKIHFGGQPTLRIDADFSEGGAYVGVDRHLAVPLHVEELRFKIRTPASKMNLRFYDSAGRVYQKEYPLSGNPDEVQELSVKRFGGPSGFASWGRGKAGEFVQPMTTYTFTVHRTDLKDRVKWTTYIGDIRLTGEIPVKVTVPRRAEQWLVAPGSTLAIPVSGTPTAGQRKYQLFRYGADKPDITGVAEFSGTALHVPVPAQNGFYEIVFPELGWRGGAIAMPDFTEKPDPYFATDAAFSIFQAYHEREGFESAVRFLKRVGIAAVRDRLTWNTLEPEQGRFNWGLSAGNGEAIRDFCRSCGLQFLDVWHDAPSWTGAVRNDPGKPGSPYPADLIHTAASWRTIAEKWRNRHSILEVWNEPEIGFGAHLPGDQVAALHRTIAWTFRNAGVNTPLCGGVFTGGIRTPEVIGPYIANGILDVSDYFSFHDYQTPLQFVQMVSDFRKLTGGHGNDGIPFLISECGKPWPRGGERAPVAADRLSGAWIAAKAIEGKACGVSQFYTFIYYYYDENQNNFGMMDRNFTPMRSMAAYVGAIRQLAGFEYAGDLPVQGVDRSRAFVSGDRAVVALYADRDNAIATLPAGFQPETVNGIDGRPLPLPDNGKLPVSDRLIYLSAPRSTVEPLLKRDTEAMRLFTLARNFRPRPLRVLPLVYQYLPDLTEQAYDQDGYLLSSPKLTLPFVANNLGNEPLTAQPRLKLPAGATASGLPEKLEIPPRSRKLFHITVDFGKLPEPDQQLQLELSDGGGRGGTVVLPFRKWQIEFLDVPVRDASADEIDPATPASGNWHKFQNWKAWQSDQRNADIQAAMRIFRTKTGLEVQVLVHDDKFHQPEPASSAWRGDSVQIALQPLYNNRIPMPTMVEITAAMTENGPVVYRHSAIRQGEERLLEKSRLTFTATQKWQLYRIELDAEELELGTFESGRRFGISALVNSNNGEARRGYLEWGGGIGDAKNQNLFNQLTLK